VLDKSETDREFYDGLNTVPNFMTGLVELWPTQALQMFISCADHFLPTDGVDPLLANAKEIATNNDSTIEKLRRCRFALRRYRLNRKTPEAAYKEVVENIIMWRLWNSTIPRKEITRYFGRVATRLRHYLKFSNVEKPEAAIVAHLKKLYPYEIWIEGIKEDAKAVPDLNRLAMLIERHNG
jgi:hypothetical protein